MSMLYCSSVMLPATVPSPCVRHNRGATLKSTLISVAVALALPAAAHGHASIAMDGETIVYVAIDSTSRSTVTVTATQSTVRLSDPMIDGGIAPGRCDP